MKKNKQTILLIFFVFISVIIPIIAFAHPGSTDGSGGHYNNDTGDYHYHHGYSAHQHENGECPYDFDDKTGENSGNSLHTTGNTTTRKSYIATTQPTTEYKQKSNKAGNFMEFVGHIILIIFVIGVLAAIYKLLLSAVTGTPLDNKKKKVEDVKDTPTNLTNPYYFAKAHNLNFSEFNKELCEEFGKYMGIETETARRLIKETRITMGLDYDRNYSPKD